MDYDFNRVIDRRNTGSIKEDYQLAEAMIPLWVADMDFEVSHEIIQAAQERLLHPIFGYTTLPASLLEAASLWYQRRHRVTYQPSDMIPYYGVVSAIHLCFMALTKEEDRVTIISPVYMRFPMSVSETSRTLNEVSMINRCNRMEIDFEQLEISLQKSNVLLLCNPHNPVGRVFTMQELTRIYDLVEKYDIMVISDEIHADLIMPGYQHIPFVQVHPKAKQRTITLVSSTKTFNIAQAGMALIVTANLDYQVAIKQWMTKFHLGAMNVISMAMVEAAYRHGDDWLDQVILYIYQNYQYVVSEFTQHMPRIKVLPLEGSYLLWLDCRNISISVVDFFETQARVRGEDGILFGQDGKGYYRLNLASPRILLEKAMNQLKEVYFTLYP